MVMIRCEAYDCKYNEGEITKGSFGKCKRKALLILKNGKCEDYEKK